MVKDIKKATGACLFVNQTLQNFREFLNFVRI